MNAFAKQRQLLQDPGGYHHNPGNQEHHRLCVGCVFQLSGSNSFLDTRGVPNVQLGVLCPLHAPSRKTSHTRQEYLVLLTRL